MTSNLELMMNIHQKQNDNGLMVFSNGSLFTQVHHQQQQQQTQIPTMNFTTADNDNIQSVPSLALMGGFNHENYSNNGKSVLECFENLSPPDPVSGTKKSLNGKKRKRNNEKVKEKPKEVIHVRAKRGQATDSHSLAERVRREKINERLRNLQDLVPGCYKTMGMAVMLDVIINYVQSLQNQIEFLSMKLSAASMYYDFNLEPDHHVTDTFQGTNGSDVQGMERVMTEGYGHGDPSYFHSTWSL
ncbi:hypothetical protein Ddye_029989 [Dipteronia dyeriana]|uniref:BHLH domain-containing protein n=1 Tax=Dipteronia dyeriana TaxID=168575 RepID=A0AAD9TFL0_9ROSI|nr:hypothetical protein Ddye_029989 [Dipteronia dyeriana]